MRFLSICLLLVGFVSCKPEEPLKTRHVSKIKFETLKQDSILSIRAIQLVDSSLYYVANNGYSGLVFYHGALFIDRSSQDSIYPSFRSIAYNGKNVFSLSIETPSYLYKKEKTNIDVFNKNNLVYQENHPKAFYDAMDFWNEEEGIAIGDPTDECMSVIITRDGGNTWTKLACDSLPKAKEGEAAFAASDTNIAIVGDHTWVATGGKASRILYSPDKGQTWNVYDTPIVQGLETTGMYSVDFYDENNGFAIGGDYTKPNDTLNNKIRTNDGGKTWQVVANGKSPGYRSCVQYIPNSKGKELIAVGFKGIDYSNDSGDSWKNLSDEGFYTIRFLNDSVAYAAGKGRISKLTFRE
jgi:hypothetical protein